jgi:hypothetical protein
MLSIYLGEHTVQQHAATLDRELARQQRVQLALVHPQGTSTETTGRPARMLGWLHLSMQAWGRRLNTVQAEDHS